MKLTVVRDRYANMYDRKTIVVGWLVHGEHLHHVWRSAVKPRIYACDCEAGQWAAPCKHISAVLRYEFCAAGLYASVAHRLDQARSHHRRCLEVTANRRPAWVTYRRKAKMT